MNTLRTAGMIGASLLTLIAYAIFYHPVRAAISNRLGTKE